MKILEIAPYVTIDSMPGLTRNKTGFGYMVYDIAAGLAKENQVDMLLLNCQYDEFAKDNIRFLANTRKKTYAGLLRLCSFLKLICFVLKYRMPLGSMVRLAYQWALMGYLDRILKEGGYDVVHIHGCSYVNVFIIDLCKKHNVRFVVTFHGLNSFDDSVKLEEAGKRFEKNFLKIAYKNNWTLTFISTGMKKRVMKYLKADRADNIHVVCNSFNFKETETEEIDIRKKYNIPAEAKIILYVGNQGENKNQKQMVRTFSMMNESVQANTYVLFLGGINNEYNIQEEINKLQYESHMIMCGIVPKEQIVAYYKQADATALFSISEGFGLSLVEGMSYGLPCIAIRTMDAFEDIYSPCAMISVERHDDQLLADGLSELLKRKWDKEAIRRYSAKFTAGVIQEKYHNLLINSCLQGGGEV